MEKLERNVSKGIYELPFKPSIPIKRVSAPSHRKFGSIHAIDWFMPIGTPIFASRDGKVINRESRCNHFGAEYMYSANFIELMHEDEEMSLYGHLRWRGVSVKLGKNVRTGEIIGYSGQTGYASYPHLHFAVYMLKNNDWNIKKPKFSKEADKKYIENIVDYDDFIKSMRK